MHNIEFTGEELDLIYDALEELKFSGEDSESEMASIIQAKIAALFQKQE